MQQVALLYSVVLMAGRRVRSADLAAVAKAAGASPVRTVLSTGNLVLESDQDPAEMEVALEQAVLELLGKPIPVFVRSESDWRELVAANPFPEATRQDPSRVAVRVMRRNPTPAILERITAAVGPGEAFAATEHALWLSTADQLSTSALIRAVGARWAGEGTFRNASAIGKIMAALEAG
jgi:uncharacterized protein (DUF1697 family)